MSDIQRLLQDASRDWKSLDWEGPFEEYLNMVVANPVLARRSHARIYDMIQWAGSTMGPDGVPQYHLFSGELYGLDRALDRLVQFFQAAARGMEVRKRILLLMGPPASGKSSVVGLLKVGLERYSRTDEGATYAVKGCPMQEEPLHLIPEERREEMLRDYGLAIEGELCPRCHYNLRHEYEGDISRVQVRRIGFSQSAGIGIGSFVATSAQGQDIARLVGSVDMAQLTGDRLDGAGKALRLEGELQAANRGIMEFIEIFKSDERFLAVMLGVTQEQVIKLGSFGAVYADEAIMAHTNEEEYNAFVNNRETAAFLDRIILVKVPYNLRVGDEERIYARMFPQGPSPQKHGPDQALRIAPLTLRVTAALAVLSRLDVPEPGTSLSRVQLRDRMKLYDGQVSPPYTRSDVERMHDESRTEGMFGLSPRYVLNRLADALSREKSCLTPRRALRSLVDGLTERAGMTKEDFARVHVLAKEVVNEYKELAVREVRRAALANYSERLWQQFDSYVQDAVAYCEVADGVSAPVAKPEEGLLCKVEGTLGLRDTDRPRYRREVVETQRLLQQRSESDVRLDEWLPTLKQAVDNVILPSRDEVRTAINPGHRNAERKRRRDELRERLISDFGYCDECADDLLAFAWDTLRGREILAIRRGKVVWI